MIDATPMSERESKWLAGLFLALCCGVAAGMLSGSGATGFVMALVAGVVVSLGILLSPGGGRSSAKGFVAYGVLVLVVPFLLLAIGYRGRGGHPVAWDALAGTFEATGPEPADLVTRDLVADLRVSEFMVRPQRMSRVGTGLSSSSVYLAPGFPMSLAFDPLRIPLRQISRCQASARHDGFTTLSVPGVSVDLHLADETGALLKWCVARGLSES
jgi:hypothetical protein